MKSKVLFAISSIGLGHASRSLFVIRELLKREVEIKIISHGDALDLLKLELSYHKDKVSFVDFEDYPHLYNGTGLKYYFNYLLNLNKIDKFIKKENDFLNSLGEKFDYIYSDGRLGFYSKECPSYLITHKLSLVLPNKLSFLQKKINQKYSSYLKNFESIMIPDFKNDEKNLSGFLTHNITASNYNCRFIGPISSYTKLEDVEKDIDYLFIITGNQSSFKVNFVKKLLDEAGKLKGKKIFILGETSKFEEKELPNDIEFYSYLSGKKKNEYFNRAKTIISHAGYSTIMDIINFEKKAILFPVANNPEQNYLCQHLSDKKLIIKGEYTKDFDLQNFVDKLDETVNFSDL